MSISITKILTSFLTVFSLFLDLILALFGGGGEEPPVPPTTDEPLPPSITEPAEGKFVFTTYGWGHGVGMSQDGAIQMAKDGKDYEEILLSYYSGTTVKTDPSTPTAVKYGGKTIPLVEYLCRTAKREIGPSAPTEALKAQIVAVYTFAKWYGFDVDSSRHAYDSSYDYNGTNLHRACLSVLGMDNGSSTPSAKYVDYNGTAAFTCYFDSCAGKTTAAASTWGGNYPYLCGGNPSPETVEIATAEFTVEEMRERILSYNSDIILGSDPAEWLSIISHDGAYSSAIGYVEKMKVGNTEIRGNAFRGSVMEYAIRSHCFKMEYIPA